MEKKIIDKSILLSWIHLAKKMRIDTSSIQHKLQISDKETHLPFSQFAFFVKWLTEKSKNNNLGLLVGEHSNLAALGIVGQIIQSSKTIHEGLEQAIRFFNLFSNVISLKLKIDDNAALLTFDIDDTSYQKFPEACQQLLITSMFFAFKEAQFLTLKKHFPITFSLAFSPKNQKEIEKHFNCKFTQSETKNTLLFEKKILDEKIVYADHELMLILEKLACKRLTEQNKHLKKTSHMVKSVVYALIDPHFPNLKTISNHLNTSERTLQRKLEKENTSYTQLITEIKKELAQDYLNKNLSIKETSYLLGYSESSAFINAFSNWYGLSPQNFKNRNINN